MKDVMSILSELNEVTVGERVYAMGLAKATTSRMHGLKRLDIKQTIASFIEYYGVEKGPDATVKAESLRIIAETVYDEVQEIHEANEEHLARSANLQHELNRLANVLKQERKEVWAEVEHVKSTHMPNDLYTKRMRQISELKEQRAEARTQLMILETENEELKRRIQELSK